MHPAFLWSSLWHCRTVDPVVDLRIQSSNLPLPLYYQLYSRKIIKVAKSASLQPAISAKHKPLSTVDPLATSLVQAGSLPSLSAQYQRYSTKANQTWLYSTFLPFSPYRVWGLLTNCWFTRSRLYTNSIWQPAMTSTTGPVPTFQNKKNSMFCQLLPQL